jgi:two-component system response regulator PilR (NtrC family)
MSQKNHVLIIDDEPDIRGLLSMTVERMGHQTRCAATIAMAKKILSEKTFDLCLTDLRLPDGSGIELVQLIQDNYPQLPVIVITAHGSMDIAVQAMKYGAFDFINKPVELPQLRALITSALNTQNTNPTPQSITAIIGESPAVLQLKNNIAKVARSQAPVFICGESGSGKELVARAIHTFSARKDKAFVAVNCGAIPRELMESEFFGHTKGSFTGAHQDKQGLFQSAEGGTLFLDEVADLPMDMQVKLLRAIQEKTVRPVGAQKEIPINVRILSATHKNLMSEIQQGAFRNDLYYRINVIEIAVPPLRQRTADIAMLCKALLEKIATKNAIPAISISKTALAALSNYHFPGNVRELENILERASTLCGDNGIEADDLHLPGSMAPASSQTSFAPVNALPEKELNHSLGLTKDYDPEKISIDDYLDNIEKNIILDTLEQHRWNRTSTAKVLGITFRSLRYRLKKLGIDDE